MLALRPKAAVLAAAIALSLFSPGKPAHACSVEPYLGAVCVFGGNFAIRGFAMARGQLLQISLYQALFSLYGTTYGGDGRTTFGLPDLRGRMPIGFGQGPGLSNYAIGNKGGSESATQTVAQMAVHTHGATVTARAQAATATTATPGGAVWANTDRNLSYSPTAPNVVMLAGSVTAVINPAGGTGGTTQPINIRQPYLAINWLVALQGIYPSRN